MSKSLEQLQEKFSDLKDAVVTESVRPLGDRVLVRRAAEEKVTAGGLALPDRSTDIPKRGTVLRLGNCRKTARDVSPGDIHRLQAQYPHNTSGDANPDGTWSVKIPFQVQVGDTVYFNKHGGIEVETGGETLLLISEEEILAFTRDES